MLANVSASNVYNFQTHQSKDIRFNSASSSSSSSSSVFGPPKSIIGLIAI